MKRSLLVGLLLAVSFQIVVLAGMVGVSALPLWTGQEIKVATVPVDPRSLLRGNYAQLSYAFSRIDSLPAGSKEGTRVYSVLRPNDNGLYEFKEATLQKPAQGVFIRGRIGQRVVEHYTTVYHIRYGIEAFFARKEKALALEKNLARGGIAVLMVSANGQARIKQVIANKS